jgi:hypothetical protein
MYVICRKVRTINIALTEFVEVLLLNIKILCQYANNDIISEFNIASIFVFLT